MEKVGDTGDISLLYFLAGANFWAILGNFWAILAILGHFWSILSHFGSFLGHFLVLIFFGQKFISAIFITFSISVKTLRSNEKQGFTQDSKDSQTEKLRRSQDSKPPNIDLENTIQQMKNRANK